jgi:hypothetical protein
VNKLPDSTAMPVPLELSRKQRGRVEYMRSANLSNITVEAGLFVTYSEGIMLFGKLALLLWLFASGISHASLVLTFTHDPYPDTNVGDVAHIGVRYVGNGPHLDGYTTRLVFDPAILTFQSYKFAGDRKNEHSIREVEVGSGWITISETGGMGLHGLLFTLDFRGSEPGTSHLFLAMINSAVSPQKSFPELLGIADESSLRVIGPTTTPPAPAPEPAAVVLLGTVIAFIAMKSFRRKRFSKPWPCVLLPTRIPQSKRRFSK